MGQSLSDGKSFNFFFFLCKSCRESVQQQLHFELSLSGFHVAPMCMNGKGRRACFCAEATQGQQERLIFGSQNDSAAVSRADGAHLSCSVALTIDFGQIWKIHLLVSAKAAQYLAGALCPERMLLYNLI